jgi:hypothetical protein
VSLRTEGIGSVNVKQSGLDVLDDPVEIRAELTVTAPLEEAAPSGLSGLSRPLRAVTGVVVAACLVATVAHVLMVSLYVAPVNPISQRYSGQIDDWIDPLFDQNWQLFAPQPQSANWQISARTMKAGPDGRAQVSSWFDLSALDDAAIKHDVFPSHTAQNTLRRAWTGYLDAFGASDQADSGWAVSVRDYLRNIAVDRVEAHRRGAVESIQLRVVTQPIPAQTLPGRPRPPAPAADIRILPWWKVPSHVR